MSFVDDIMANVKAKNAAEPEFHQAVEEVVESLELRARAPARVQKGQNR